MSTQSFSELGVSRAVASSLSEQGITEPFPIQQAVIGDALAGLDVIVRSPTGSGKTLAFGIPLVERIAAEARRPAGLVLAPTRELATQIVEDIRGVAHSRALRVTAVYGGVGLIKQAKEAAVSQIIVATPGRLEDLLARGAFRLDAIQVLILDEADRMLDMGFRPAIDRIVGACPRVRQTLFFSATLAGEAGKLARGYAHDPQVHEQGPAALRPGELIEHRFVEVSHEHRVQALVGELSAERDLTLVFVRTKHGADRLVKRLRAGGVEALAMHGNKSQRQREQALARFESGTVDTLVATDVAARGIDIDGISHVINFDPPADSDTYIHRVGRTGRAGRTGIGITLVGPGEHRDVLQLAGRLGIKHSLGGPAAAGHAETPAPHRAAGLSSRGGASGPSARGGASGSRPPRRRSGRGRGGPRAGRPAA